jgi:hypothetical protein
MKRRESPLRILSIWDAIMTELLNRGVLQKRKANATPIQVSVDSSRAEELKAKLF